MKLAVFNGSPRGKTSNTQILVEKFLNGFRETEGNSSDIAYLIRIKSQAEFLELFSGADSVLLAFPLYTDAMPSIVKTFIESLGPLCNREGNPSIGFIVQCGFPETLHIRYIERYLRKLAGRLGCPLLGVAVKGGVEGIQVMPSIMTRKLFNNFYRLGQDFGKTGLFNQQLIRDLAGRERYGPLGRLFIRILAKLGFTDAYWNSQLKKNNAYQKRYARPDTGFPS